ncbi:dedicator of cytokinesis protein 1 [Lasius niger]|uniref:Dedicator of cytokinesis protein 1 n=1 Tax=Lasius niger TaxID=67767 RepID=A0A0J7L6Q2_LASNI|nr:dedicator of cytokinesis protein 1 [Lasius niger]
MEIYAHLFTQLTPKRPLRSEAEKERRISNRWSGQSQHYLRNINNELEPSSLGKGNRDSVGTTDSTASEDDPPPPLPIKMREADYCNLPEELSSNQCPASGTLNNLNKSSGQWKNKLPTPTDDDVDSHSNKPPTPPPKPKRPIHSLQKIVLASNDVETSHVEDSSTA